METEGKKDLFGHKTQGVNYELFRPKYLQELLDHCVEGLPHRRNFMDVATGTGQVLFPLCEKFSGVVIGTDISSNMLKVASEKAAEVKNRTGLDIRILKQECLEPPPDNLKFDLIAVGEAIHWFNVDAFLELTKNRLTETGKFVCLGYYLDRIDPVGAVMGECTLYKQFLDKTMPVFAVDMNELFDGYTAPRYTFQ
jgi:ubiquinone/menaquinone biosynthesis C-methylase UbiE